MDEIKKKFSLIPKNVFIVPPESAISTYTLASIANAAIIYGTKAGVEMTAMGIPTIVAGEAWIRGKGVTIDVNSREDYIKVLEKLPFKNKLSESIRNRALKYAYHFFFRRMIYVSSVKPSKKSCPFVYNFSNIKHLDKGFDKGLDVICNGILNGGDYIYDKIDNK